MILLNQADAYLYQHFGSEGANIIKSNCPNKIIFLPFSIDDPVSERLVFVKLDGENGTLTHLSLRNQNDDDLSREYLPVPVEFSEKEPQISHEINEDSLMNDELLQEENTESLVNELYKSCPYEICPTGNEKSAGFKEYDNDYQIRQYLFTTKQYYGMIQKQDDPDNENDNQNSVNGQIKRLFPVKIESIKDPEKLQSKATLRCICDALADQYPSSWVRNGKNIKRIQEMLVEKSIIIRLSNSRIEKKLIDSLKMAGGKAARISSAAEDITFTLAGKSSTYDSILFYKCKENGRNCLAFTDRSFAGNDNIRVFPAFFQRDGDIILLTLINETDKEWSIIEDILGEMQDTMEKLSLGGHFSHKLKLVRFM